MSSTLVLMGGWAIINVESFKYREWGKNSSINWFPHSTKIMVDVTLLWGQCQYFQSQNITSCPGWPMAYNRISNRLSDGIPCQVSVGPQQIKTTVCRHDKSQTDKTLLVNTISATFGQFSNYDFYNIFLAWSSKLSKRSCEACKTVV